MMFHIFKSSGGATNGFTDKTYDTQSIMFVSLALCAMIILFLFVLIFFKQDNMYAVLYPIALLVIIFNDNHLMIAGVTLAIIPYRGYPEGNSGSRGRY